jgi:hypothetical protein
MVICLKLKNTGAAHLVLAVVLAATGIWLWLTSTGSDSTMLNVIGGSLCLFSIAMFLLGLKYLRASPAPIRITEGSIEVPLDLMAGTTLRLAGNEITGWSIKSHLHPLARVLEVRSRKGISVIPLDTIKQNDLAHVVTHLRTIANG